MRIIFALVCGGWLAGCAGYPKDDVAAVVTAPYPGKGQIDQCDVYANALMQALKEKHVQAWKVCYLNGGWEKSYVHALVVYQHAGAYWYVDNMFPYPTRTWGKKPREWAQDRDRAFIMVVKTFSNGVESHAPDFSPITSGSHTPQ